MPLIWLANAHTSDGELAPAVTTVSLFLPGNALSWVQAPPLSRQAVSAVAALLNWPPNAQPLVLPVATTAVKTPPLVLTDLTTCQCGAAGAAEAGAASATVAAQAPAATSQVRPRIALIRAMSPVPFC